MTTVENHNNDWGEEIEIYPNPVLEDLTISLEGIQNKKPWQFRLFDATGKEVYRSQISSEVLDKINVAHLNPGLYWLCIFSADDNVVKKMMKL